MKKAPDKKLPLRLVKKGQKPKGFRAESYSMIDVAYQKLGLKSPTALKITSQLVIICGGSANKAVILNQLMVWIGRGSRADDWVYKSYRELSGETGIARQSVYRYLKEFKDAGFLETKVRKIKGQRTFHYLINPDKLEVFWSRQIYAHYLLITNP